MAARSISAALSLALQLSSAALIFIAVAEADYTTASVAETAPEAVNRNSFPAGFIFGTASAAYQVVQENFKPTFNVGGNIYKRTMGPLCNVVQEISKPTSNVGGNVYRRTMGPLCNYEGAAKEGGKGPSIWDTFIHNNPGVIIDGSNGDVAIDFYHRYKEDIGFLKYMGMDAFRFSFSWPRILPKGSLSGGVNKEGILFYNNLINDLLANGIQPFVTLFHWDFPQALESKYKGFLSPHVVDDYRDYAEICFREFGDRVKHWITFNQPWSYCKNGYSTGTNAPGRCSSFENANCTAGDSSREPYICGHHLLLAHAAAVKTYRDKYQKNQKGKIGITLVTHWFVPYSNSKADFDAVSRSLDFMFGWFMDPLTQGDYPFSMRAIVRDRLPTFTSKQSQLVKDSFDFLGLNYYTTHYANSFSLLRRVNVSYDSDTHILESGVRRGVPIGPQAASAWLFVYPQGFRELLLYVKNKYNNPLIYITENGVDEANNASWPLEKALRDDRRIDYYRKHLYFLNKAIREGVNVRGYFAWSLLDNFEWRNGYTVRFGIIYVDYKNRLKRYPKISAHWFKKFLK